MPEDLRLVVHFVVHYARLGDLNCLLYLYLHASRYHDPICFLHLGLTLQRKCLWKLFVNTGL